MSADHGDVHTGVDRADVHAVAKRRLGTAGLVYTTGRRELVELLAGFGRPATIAELIDHRPRLTQSSMYRNMGDLESAGVVQKVAGTDERARFELADALIGHHHHSICTSCGAVDDFVVPADAERALDVALAQALHRSGFRAAGHRLDVLGVCADCA